ncbi:MAG: electron transporter RnfB [Desulfobacterales bacterium RIFOXYA12_FULL_46_15]|nr:MAG: electron transporter RnfB [Desulfobacterales bacterium RIFOXYA12_FULL_46_15]
MLQSIILMGGLGVIIGTVLAIASKAFYVYEDPTVVAVAGALPGANCGGCGYPGCNANAEAIVKGLSAVNSCVAAGAEVALEIAAIMGVAVSDREPEFAGPGCYYSKDAADMEYQYLGITDCRAAEMLFGGMKVCRIGCLGLGTCVKACMFGALTIGRDGLPKVDRSKCTGCGACERVCPKHIIRLSSVTRRILREYTREECLTPCQRACPTGIDIKEYIRLIREGDYEGSVQVIKERNPFPTVISRICPAICESKCRRLLQDESVAINGLKRFVCDYEMNLNRRVLPYKAPATGKKVAVIGGGVEGLSVAFFSARLGHEPTVFEATDSLGGILRKAVKRERLSMDVLDWDIEGIRQMGVDIRTGAKAGKDFSVDGLLKQGFHAVFTATGGWDSRLLRGDTDEAETVFPGAYLFIDLLRSKADDHIRIPSGKKVVIAGGERLVAEAAEILRENGSTNITVISRKTESEPLFDRDTLERLSKAGADVIYHSGITKVKGEDGRLTLIEYMELNTGEKHDVEADLLIIGAGRFPELVFIPEIKDQQEGKSDQPENQGPMLWEGYELQKKPAGKQESGFFSDQDVISEYASAVSAINGGRKAAAAIHYRVTHTGFQDASDMITETSMLQDVFILNNVNMVSRVIMNPVDRIKGTEDEFSTGFSVEQAKQEANRCLKCGLVCYEKTKIEGQALK